MPRTCVPNALPIDYRVSLPWGWDFRRMPKEMVGLMEGGGLPTVEDLLGEDEEEEEQREQTPAASEVELS